MTWRSITYSIRGYQRKWSNLPAGSSSISDAYNKANNYGGVNSNVKHFKPTDRERNIL